jgi:hypothetical protein
MWNQVLSGLKNLKGAVIGLTGERLVFPGATSNRSCSHRARYDCSRCERSSERELVWARSRSERTPLEQSRRTIRVRRLVAAAAARRNAPSVRREPSPSNCSSHNANSPVLHRLRTHSFCSISTPRSASTHFGHVSNAQRAIHSHRAWNPDGEMDKTAMLRQNREVFDRRSP